MCCQQNDGEPQRKSYLRSFTVSADRGLFNSFLICKSFNFDSESSRRSNDRFEKKMENYSDYYTFLGNCPPTPRVNQHFARSEK